MVQPASFAAEWCEDWSRWVLRYGLLPELPADLAIGESVPVAYWRGSDTAAVVHIRRIMWPGDQEPETESNVEAFTRLDGRWQSLGGGGAGWAGRPPLARIDVPSDLVQFSGCLTISAVGGGCVAAYGIIGTDASLAEVEQHGTTTGHRIRSATGAFVVTAALGPTFTIRISDRHGLVLGQFDG